MERRNELEVLTRTSRRVCGIALVARFLGGAHCRRLEVVASHLCARGSSLQEALTSSARCQVCDRNLISIQRDDRRLVDFRSCLDFLLSSKAEAPRDAKAE